MSMNLVTLLYLIASVCFIQALKGLSHPTTSIRGNLFGMTGMGIAILTTGALIVQLAGGAALGLVWVLVGLVLGGGLGAVMAKRVEMTKMPELVAFMHSMIGLAAVFIAIAAVAEPHAFGITAKGSLIPAGNRLELFLGAAIGAITFSGSVTGFPPPFTFEWRRGGAPILTNVNLDPADFFTFTAPSTVSTQQFRVVVKNAANFQPGILSNPANVVTLTDTDADNIPDEWEEFYGFNIFDGRCGGQYCQWVLGVNNPYRRWSIC